MWGPLSALRRRRVAPGVRAWVSLDLPLSSFTNLAARACVLYGVERPTPAMLRLMEVLVESTTVLKDSVPFLRTHRYADLTEAARTLRQLEKEADKAYRDEISRLFGDDSVDAKTVLKLREVLEDMERAVDHCDHVAANHCCLGNSGSGAPKK